MRKSAENTEHFLVVQTLQKISQPWPTRRLHQFTFPVIVALLAAVLTGVQLLPSQAAGGSGTWAKWATSAGLGTLDLSVGGFTSPSANFTTNGTGLSVASGSSTWLNTATPIGAQYGSSRDRGYLQLGTATGGAPSTTTFTFTGNTPTSGWGFAVGDIDADRIKIEATDNSGNPVAVSSWFQGTFNYCNGVSPSPCSGGVDTPNWNGVDTVTGNGSDTSGSSAWFQPNTSIKTLKFTFTKLTGFPNYQLWFAGDTQPADNYKITLVARSCPDYTDIMANRARNNIMESLKNLGVDSIYPQPAYVGSVRPAVEELSATGQDACTPLTNWTFASGSGISGKDSGTFGSLSKVGGLSGQYTTQPSVPLLDTFGNATGQIIEGAVTYNLTAAQVTQAARRTFWIQGGTPGDPLNGQSAGYAFGTLRCAQDNANADNVEWAGYSSTQRHIFCYAYYVASAEQRGTIIVRKEMAGGSPTQSFSFGGDVSFANGGAFTLTAGTSQTFTRAAGETWTVFENTPIAPIAFDNVLCNSAGGSTIAYTPADRKAEVTLASGDTVTCTFTNKFAPTTHLDVYKVTQGATGTFDFAVDSISIPGVVVSDMDTPTNVFSSGGFAAGDTVDIEETGKPAAVGGVWQPAQMNCAAVDVNGDPLADPAIAGQPEDVGGAQVTLSNVHDSKNACIITNTFTPNAKVRVHAQVIGGSGAISVDSTYLLTDSNALLRNASDQPGIEETLTNNGWDAGGEQGFTEDSLNFGTYQLTGIAPENSATQTWTLDRVECTGGVNPTINGSQVSFDLSNGNVNETEIDCTYFYRVTSLVNFTIAKKSIGAIGTFTLTTTIGDSIVSGEVTTTSENTPETALQLNLIPDGTVITLGESDIQGPANGSWNGTTGGEPTWLCHSTSGANVTVDSGTSITIPAEDTTCTAQNVFVEGVELEAERYDMLPRAGGNLFEPLLVAVEALVEFFVRKFS